MEGLQNESFMSSAGLARLIYVQMAVRAAIELKVFDIIASSGPEAALSCSEILLKIPTTNPDASSALERILRMLGVNSILSMSSRPIQNGESTQLEVTYGLTMESRSLATNVNGLCGASMVMYQSEKELVECLYMLKDSVLKQGCLPPFKAYHGVGFFEHLSKKPDLARAFNDTLANLSNMLVDALLMIYKGFEGVSELMDVGGNLGGTIQKIVSKYPNIRGINLDMHHVIANAPKYNGVEHVSGDMFESIPKAQTIFMKFILHDWNDEQCIKILKNCWSALPDNGKVISAEFLVPQVLESDIECATVITFDFMMMVRQDGKERKAVEFAALAKAAGFSETKFFPISQGFHIIEFIK